MQDLLHQQNIVPENTRHLIYQIMYLGNDYQRRNIELFEGVDAEEVWHIIQEHIPALKENMQNLLKD